MNSSLNYSTTTAKYLYNTVTTSKLLITIFCSILDTKMLLHPEVRLLLVYKLLPPPTPAFRTYNTQCGNYCQTAVLQRLLLRLAWLYHIPPRSGFDGKAGHKQISLSLLQLLSCLCTDWQQQRISFKLSQNNPFKNMRPYYAVKTET